MRNFRVFTGAPSMQELEEAPTDTSYQWQTVTSEPKSVLYPLPPATVEAASRRISLLYQNMIFRDTEEGDLDYDGDQTEEQENPGDQHHVPCHKEALI